MEEAGPSTTMTLEAVTDEGRRLAVAAAEHDLPFRMMGGVAVFVRCPSAVLPALARTYGDVDFVGLSHARGEITDFLEANGYVGDGLFNALHGAQRLNYVDPVRGRPLDVIFDRFAMCHTLDLRKRLQLEPLTIPLTDLMLTKLQVVEINDKDIRDLLVLLHDHEPDLGRLQEVLDDDWGFEHTVRRTLDRVLTASPSFDLPVGFVDVVAARVAAITAALDTGAKSLRWRARRRLGERVRWYELPEEGRR